MYELREVPCKCGFTHEKNSEEFEIYELEIAKSFPKMKVPRCKKCQTISILERPCLSCQMYKSDRRTPTNLPCSDCGDMVNHCKVCKKEKVACVCMAEDEKCKHKLKYNERFDAYYCSKCDRWQEKECDDKKCFFCVPRPERPSMKTPDLPVRFQREGKLSGD